MANPNPDVAIKIKAMLEAAQPRFTEKCCIYRVSHEIRKLNEDAYTPKVVSIGPFHHGDQYLLNMEELKRIFCRQFIERSMTNNLESLVSCVQELEPMVRGCYSDNIKLTEEEHVMVILVDCCFILEFLLKFHFGWTDRDAIILPLNLRGPIAYDLLLLENQVPFFVLEMLYNLALDSPPFPLLALSLFYIVPYSIIVPDSIISGDVLRLLSNDTGIAHFIDLSRKFLLASSGFSGCLREAEFANIYTATELSEAGVKFKVNKNSQCMLDLELSGHCLRVPSISVTAFTEAILRNLIAFEQCHCMKESYLADYIVALDLLINTEKDVDLLIKKGIIQNWLGSSNAVAEMFNGLALRVINPDFNVQYIRIFKELNAFCRHPCNQKVATLRRDYCNTPWKTVASIAGIFLLILTVIQTVFSILQVVH
ncbi:UPF0481 protein At3g47200-like [Arachis ipaensis]|uniref:UPF0481 protein At3g47200-like n=1 Tax=Arachis ipaensis TaxID=130454 RepID=UPI0007AF6742|nr:UPF0481 protein At3g47200-like [Arachis ipaensis]XP_020962650.1 UPF0481 protein At3g47200-like [Arachis ipaensis]XP_025664269.1 UPF0481 protein At3g47200 [Arachis hypogaea]XP_029150198.1 UPF0481 protein At3g47200 [Arachis hypogaea]